MLTLVRELGGLCVVLFLLRSKHSITECPVKVGLATHSCWNIYSNHVSHMNPYWKFRDTTLQVNLSYLKHYSISPPPPTI